MAFSREDLDKYRSFIVCDDDDGTRFLAALRNADFKAVTLSFDKATSSLVERPKTISIPESHYRINADTAFEMLSENQFDEV